MHVRFLFRLCRFTFCSCDGSSLFDIIINAQGVVTCLPLNSASMLRRFISSVTLWMRSSSIMVVKWIPNPFKTWPNSLSIPLPPIGRDLSHLIWALQIWRHLRILCGWLARPIAHDQQQFSLTFACHALIIVWNCSIFIQNLLPFKGTSIKTVDFQSAGPTLYD